MNYGVAVGRGRGRPRGRRRDDDYFHGPPAHFASRSGVSDTDTRGSLSLLVEFTLFSFFGFISYFSSLFVILLV